MLSVCLFEHGSECHILSPKYQARFSSLFESTVIHCVRFKLCLKGSFSITFFKKGHTVMNTLSKHMPDFSVQKDAMMLKCNIVIELQP